MNILKRFDMPEDLFDKKQERPEGDLLKCFIKHSENPYLEMKRSNDIKHTLIKAKFMKHPVEAKARAEKQKVLDEQKDMVEQKRVLKEQLAEKRREDAEIA